jgi:hypothetical protein
MEVYIVYMELLLGHEEIITKSGISLNAGTLNRGFTVDVAIPNSHNLHSTVTEKPQKLQP